MANKTLAQRLASIVVRLTRKFAPDEIQAELGRVYEEYSAAGDSEAEVEFWLKCSRASHNLSSGMNKWAHEMIEDIEEGEE